MQGILDVHVHSASGLPLLCAFGEQDVYVRFRFGELDPMSHAVLQSLRCEVFMAQPRTKDQLLGYVDIPLQDAIIPKGGKRPKRPSEYQLASESSPACGTLFLTLAYHGHRGTSGASQGAADQMGRGTKCRGRGPNSRRKPGATNNQDSPGMGPAKASGQKTTVVPVPGPSTPSAAAPPWAASGALPPLASAPPGIMAPAATQRNAVPAGTSPSLFPSMPSVAAAAAAAAVAAGEVAGAAVLASLGGTNATDDKTIDVGSAVLNGAPHADPRTTASPSPGPPGIQAHLAQRHEPSGQMASLDSGRQQGLGHSDKPDGLSSRSDLSSQLSSLFAAKGKARAGALENQAAAAGASMPPSVNSFMASAAEAQCSKEEQQKGTHSANGGVEGLSTTTSASALSLGPTGPLTSSAASASACPSLQRLFSWSTPGAPEEAPASGLKAAPAAGEALPMETGAPAVLTAHGAPAAPGPKCALQRLFPWGSGSASVAAEPSRAPETSKPRAPEHKLADPALNGAPSTKGVGAAGPGAAAEDAGDEDPCAISRLLSWGSNSARQALSSVQKRVLGGGLFRHGDASLAGPAGPRKDGDAYTELGLGPSSGAGEAGPKGSTTADVEMRDADVGSAQEGLGEGQSEQGAGEEGGHPQDGESWGLRLMQLFPVPSLRSKDCDEKPSQASTSMDWAPAAVPASGLALLPPGTASSSALLGAQTVIAPRPVKWTPQGLGMKESEHPPAESQQQKGQQAPQPCSAFRPYCPKMASRPASAGPSASCSSAGLLPLAPGTLPAGAAQHVASVYPHPLAMAALGLNPASLGLGLGFLAHGAPQAQPLSTPAPADSAKPGEERTAHSDTRNGEHAAFKDFLSLQSPEHEPGPVKGREEETLSRTEADLQSMDSTAFKLSTGSGAASVLQRDAREQHQCAEADIGLSLMPQRSDAYASSNPQTFSGRSSAAGERSSSSRDGAGAGGSESEGVMLQEVEWGTANISLQGPDGAANAMLPGRLSAAAADQTSSLHAPPDEIGRGSSSPSSAADPQQEGAHRRHARGSQEQENGATALKAPLPGPRQAASSSATSGLEAALSAAASAAAASTAAAAALALQDVDGKGSPFAADKAGPPSPHIGVAGHAGNAAGAAASAASRKRSFSGPMEQLAAPGLDLGRQAQDQGLPSKARTPPPFLEVPGGAKAGQGSGGVGRHISAGGGADPQGASGAGSCCKRSCPENRSPSKGLLPPASAGCLPAGRLAAGTFPDRLGPFPLKDSNETGSGATDAPLPPSLGMSARESALSRAVASALERSRKQKASTSATPSSSGGLSPGNDTGTAVAAKGDVGQDAGACASPLKAEVSSALTGLSPSSSRSNARAGALAGGLASSRMEGWASSMASFASISAKARAVAAAAATASPALPAAASAAPAGRAGTRAGLTAGGAEPVYGMPVPMYSKQAPVVEASSNPSAKDEHPLRPYGFQPGSFSFLPGNPRAAEASGKDPLKQWLEMDPLGHGRNTPQGAEAHQNRAPPSLPSLQQHAAAIWQLSKSMAELEQPQPLLQALPPALHEQKPRLLHAPNGEAGLGTAADPGEFPGFPTHPAASLGGGADAKGREDAVRGQNGARVELPLGLHLAHGSKGESVLAGASAPEQADGMPLGLSAVSRASSSPPSSNVESSGVTGSIPPCPATAAALLEGSVGANKEEVDSLFKDCVQQGLMSTQQAVAISGALSDSTAVEELKRSIMAMESRMSSEAVSGGADDEVRRQAWRQFWDRLDSQRRENGKKGGGPGVVYGCRAFF